MITSPDFIDFKVLEIPSPSAGGTVWISRPAVPALPPICEQADILPRPTSAHHPETAMPTVGLEGVSLLASGAAEVDLPRCTGPSAWCGSWCEMNENYASGGPWCDAWRTIVAGSRPTSRGHSSSSTECRRFESCRGHHHSPDKTSLDQHKHRTIPILCSAIVCRHQAPSATVCETIAKRRTGLGTSVDRLLRPRLATSPLLVPNPDPRSDRPSRQTDRGGPRAVPCRCRLVRRRAEGRGAFPPPDHR